jgi:hypothetical protein
MKKKTKQKIRLAFIFIAVVALAASGIAPIFI